MVPGQGDSLTSTTPNCNGKESLISVNSVPFNKAYKIILKGTMENNSRQSCKTGVILVTSTFTDLPSTSFTASSPIIETPTNMNIIYTYFIPGVCTVW